MTIGIRALHPLFVGEVEGLDLRRPLGIDEIAAIHEAMDRHAVLVFRDQRLDDEAQLAFTRQLGPIVAATGGLIAKPGEGRLGIDIADLSNLDEQDRIMAADDRRRLYNLGNRLWHSDRSFCVVPAKYSALSGRRIPGSGGDTEFADMRAAHDALDAVMRATIADLVCEHSLMYSRAILGFTDYTAEERSTFAPVRHRLVRTNPRTGRKSLFLSAHAGAIVGWSLPEARDLLRELTEHATRREFVHAHRWRQDDLVIWDNRQTMHRVRRFDDTRTVRDVRRTTTLDDGPTVEQGGGVPARVARG
jgi:alpha-ketoglutarate-dependent 2,4-dichlorophenoxyacetate dioxygenase